jgi:YebC/PmpR family DNA-binding regulatory protein
MAGHSKWKNIRLHKGKADVERAKLFGKLSRELTIAAKMGGGSPESNPRLRLAIDKARAGSMPADNIKRAIQKGTGELASENYEEITYEGYGPNGVAVMVEAATDNRNRTVADVRSYFTKTGGSLGENGSVSWQFKRLGVIEIADEGQSEDTLFEAALEAGAENLERTDTGFEITTDPDGLSDVKTALETAGVTVGAAELRMVPTVTVALDAEAAKKMLKLMDLLEDHDDVQNVYANFDIPDEVMAEIS